MNFKYRMSLLNPVPAGIISKTGTYGFSIDKILPVLTVLLLCSGAFMSIFAKDSGYPKEMKVTDDGSDNVPDVHLNNVYPSRSGDPLLKVMLSEIMFNPYGEDTGREWLSIYNSGENDVDLEGWGISNRDGEIDAVLSDIILPGFCTLVVHFGRGDAALDFQDDTFGHYYTQNHFETFNNTLGSAALYMVENDLPSIVDYVSWKINVSDTSIPGKAERDASGADLLEGNIFRINTTYVEGSSLGRVWYTDNDTFNYRWVPGTVLINEIMFVSPEGVNSHEALEIRNPLGGSVNTQSWYIESSSGSRYELPEILLPPGSCIVLNFMSELTVFGYVNDTDLTDGCAEYYYRVVEEVFDDNIDDVGLYSPTKIVDYVGWGDLNTRDVSTDAQDNSMWTLGSYVEDDFETGDSIGRDQFSTDTNTAEDWDIGGGPFANGPTLGKKNSYSLFIYDYTLGGAPGTEEIVLYNYGEELNLSGFRIFNGQGQQCALIEDVILPEESVIFLHFGPGVDDTGYSEINVGHWYSDDEGTSSEPDIFNNTGDVVILTSGSMIGRNIVDFQVWTGDRLYADTDLPGGMIQGEWSSLIQDDGILFKGITDDFRIHTENICTLDQYITNRIVNINSWFDHLVSQKVISDELLLSDYLNIIFQNTTRGWSLEITGMGIFSKDISRFPDLEFQMEAVGSISIEKKCGYLVREGEILFNWGLFGEGLVNEKFDYSLFGHATHLVSADDISIVDTENSAAYTGHVSAEANAELDSDMVSILGCLSPAITIQHHSHLWNAGILAWNGEYDYGMCRLPEAHFDSIYSELPITEGELIPVWYDGGYSMVKFDNLITYINKDSVTRRITSDVLVDDMAWAVDGNGITGGQNIASGDSYTTYLWLDGPDYNTMESTFLPRVSMPEQYTDSQVFAAPGNDVTMEFTVENLASSIEGFNLTVDTFVQGDRTNNSTMKRFIPVEILEIEVSVVPNCEYQVRNSNGAIMPLADMQGPDGHKLMNIHPGSPRTFIVELEIPKDADIGTDYQVYFNITSNLPGYEGNPNNTYNATGTVILGGENIQTLWSEDLENQGALTGWEWTGDWEYGERTFFPAEGPNSDDPGPNIFSTNRTGVDTPNNISILSTPHLDLSGYDFVNLRLWQWIYSSIEPVLYCNSSGVWYPLKIWEDPNNQWGSWRNESFDISKYLSDSVQFIFYYDTNDGGYYSLAGWHIDNISIVAKSSTGEVEIVNLSKITEGGVYEPGNHEVEIWIENNGNVPYNDLNIGAQVSYTTKEYLFQDNFNEDKGWTVTGDNLGASWLRDYDVNFGSSIGRSMNIGGENSGGLLPGNTYRINENDSLLSPTIDISGAVSPVLVFWENSWMQESGDSCELYLSSDGGVSWDSVPVWTDSTNSGGKWNRVSIDISLYQSSQFKMKFIFRSDSGVNGPFMAIDEISILKTNWIFGDQSDFVLPYLGPGDLVNVSLPINLDIDGEFYIRTFVNATEDADQSNNVRWIWGYVNSDIVPRILYPDGEENITGSIKLGAQLDHPDIVRCHFYQRGPVLERNSDDPVLIGEAAGPFENSSWYLDWDTYGLPDGQYELTAEFTDDGGAVFTDIVQVVVQHPSVDIDVIIIHSQEPGKWNEFNFIDNSTATADIVARRWDFGDGSDASTREITHSFPAPGNYTIMLTITAGHYYADTLSVVVEVGEPPEPVSEVWPGFEFSPILPRAGDAVIFNQTCDYLNITLDELEFNWFFGDGNNSSGMTVNHSYEESGVYNVTLYVSVHDPTSETEDARSAWNITQQIMVRERNISTFYPPIASFRYLPAFPWVNEMVNFTDTSRDIDGSIVSWNWDFGDGSTSSGKNTSHFYTAKGTYQVTLTVIDDDGLNSSVSKNLTVRTEWGLMDRNMTILEGLMGRMMIWDDYGNMMVKLEVMGNGTLRVRMSRTEDMSSAVGEVPPELIDLGVFLEITLEELDCLMIEMPYKDSDIPEGGKAEDLRLYFWNESSGSWEMCESTYVDTENHTIYANVTHLTIFAPMASTGVDDGSGGGGSKDYTTLAIIVGVIIVLIILVIFVYVKRRKIASEDDDEEYDEDMDAESDLEEKESDSDDADAADDESIEAEDGDSDDDIDSWDDDDDDEETGLEEDTEKDEEGSDDPKDNDADELWTSDGEILESEDSEGQDKDLVFELFDGEAEEKTDSQEADASGEDNKTDDDSNIDLEGQGDSDAEDDDTAWDDEEETADPEESDDDSIRWS